MMSSFRFVVITAVLTVVAGAGGHLLAQEYTKPVPAQLSDAHIRGEQQQVLRPPRNVGPDDSDLTGSVDPQPRTAIPPEVRPETGPTNELSEQFRRTLVDYRGAEPVGTIIVDTANT
jgi:hypothetical protein